MFYLSGTSTVQKSSSSSSSSSEASSETKSTIIGWPEYQPRKPRISAPTKRPIKDKTVEPKNPTKSPLTTPYPTEGTKQPSTNSGGSSASGAGVGSASSSPSAATSAGAGAATSATGPDSSASATGAGSGSATGPDGSSGSSAGAGSSSSVSTNPEESPDLSEPDDSEPLYPSGKRSPTYLQSITRNAC